MIPACFRHLLPAFTGSILHCTLFVTSRCNADCGFCFYRKDSLRTRTLQHDELTLAELETISRQFGPLLWLALSGGEIFLRPDLAEIVRIFYANNRPSFILLPTNGLFTERIVSLTGTIAAACPTSIVTVKLSLDGPPDVHDRLRRVTGAFAGAQRTFHALTDLQTKHPNLEVGFNSVLCRETEKTMAETIDLVNNTAEGVPHTITLVRGEPGSGVWGEVAAERYADACRLLELRKKKAGKGCYRFAGARWKAAQDVIQRRIIHRIMSGQGFQIPCPAGRRSVVITENGDLYPCENFSFLLGNLRQHNYRIKSILDTDRAREIRAGITRKKCFCTHECYLMLAILFNPRLYPELVHEYVRLART